MSDISNDTAVIGITIEKFEERYTSGKTVTFYLIIATNHITKASWRLEKRFSEFKALHDTLTKLIVNVPSIPSITFFKVTAFEDLKKRQDELQSFLRQCINRKDILSTETFRQFLDIATNAPEIINEPVKLHYEYPRVPLGVRDFIYIPEREIIVLCCSDMNIISRADSLFTNFSFPWEKKSDSWVPLGAAFVYQVTKDERNNSFIVHKIWAKSFPIQTGIVGWNNELEIYNVGLDDGTVYSFQHQHGSQYTQFDTLHEIHYHTARIMGLAFDDVHGYLYSCSSDKLFCVTTTRGVNVFNETHTHVVKVSKTGYTNMHYDKGNERLFLTNESGEFFVFSSYTYPPVELMYVQISSFTTIRALHVDERNKLIFVGSVNGNISILNLGSPGKEKLISEISTFGENLKIRICRYFAEQKAVITGDEDGRVVVWSLKNGQPILCWEAHNNKPITQMYFDEDNLQLWTAGKDNAWRVWNVPKKFDTDEVEKFEKEGIKDIVADIAMMKLQKAMSKIETDEESDSSDDDLNGWDFDE